MERSSRGHMEEAVNLKSFYLRLVKRIWILPLAALVGGVLGVLIYSLATGVFGPSKTYKSEAKLYLNFAYNENTGTLVDYYNAYTWNTLLPTDAILEPIVNGLSESGISVTDESSEASVAGSRTISRDELIAALNADIPSDVRVMVLTAECADKELADAIIKAAVRSMENYGNTNTAFDSIQRLSIDNARLVTYTDRTFVAAIFGAVCGCVFAVLTLLLLEAMDDAVYCPEDCEKRYKLPAIGVLFAQEDAFFRNELKAAYDKIVNGAGEVAVISTDSVDDAKKSEKDLESLKSALGKEEAGDGTKLVAMAVPGSVLDNYRKIGTCDGVILCVPYGKRNGAMAEHIIAQLKKHECPVLGIVLVRASKSFLYSYYGIKRKRA